MARVRRVVEWCHHPIWTLHLAQSTQRNVSGGATHTTLDRKVARRVAGQRDKIISRKDLPCADRSWTAGSRSPLVGAVGRAVEKTRQAEQAEAHHAKAHGHEDVIEVCSEPDRGSATGDRDCRADDTAGDWPSHAPHPLPDAVKCIAHREKSEERPNGPKVGRPDRQNSRMAAE
jgi:hypothetical protein